MIVGLVSTVVGALIAISALRSAVIIDFSNSRVSNRHLITKTFTLARGDKFKVLQVAYPTPHGVLALTNGVSVRPLAAVAAASNDNRARLAEVAEVLNEMLMTRDEAS